MSKIVGGWRVVGRPVVCLGIPAGGLAGIQPALFGGDNRLTVLDDTGWRAPTQGDNFDPLVDLWWDPAAFNPSQVDTVAQLQGYKAGVLRAEFGNAEGAQSRTSADRGSSTRTSRSRGRLVCRRRGSNSGSRCSTF